VSLSPNQIADLSAPLDASHVKQRDQAGRRVSYIEAWHCIAEANRIFGFDAWDREMAECRCVTERETKIGQQQRDGWRVGYVARVKITVHTAGQDIVREGSGYGSGIDVDLGAAHESAIKEAESDAMKRGFMTFGNPFGLSLYNKDQPIVVSETRAPPSRDKERPADVKLAMEYRDRIKKAINSALEPGLIDEIMHINRAELLHIKKVHQPTYEKLIQLSLDRQEELLAVDEAVP
jgi:recombination DNA repair RAD52 pathway protein